MRKQAATAITIERDVRQLLANKVSGTCVGLWMLLPGHLRLGTWDLLKGWSDAGDTDIAPRLAMQLVHEAAVCATGIRRGRSLGQKGFERLTDCPSLPRMRQCMNYFAGTLLPKPNSCKSPLE